MLKHGQGVVLTEKAAAIRNNMEDWKGVVVTSDTSIPLPGRVPVMWDHAPLGQVWHELEEDLMPRG